MTPLRAVTLRWPDDHEETIPAASDRTVLEAAEAADVAIPFGCRTGACGICVGRATAGQISHGRPPRALKPCHLEADHVLCCIARPETDCRIAVGADVRAGLATNPWR